jgi:glycosyltransferase involved in cell wall biosynthesis
MRIGAVYDRDLPNCNYRATIPLSALERRGHEFVDSRDLDVLLGCDLVHFHRQHGPNTERGIRALRQAGVVVSYDNDDDIASVPDESPFIRNYGRQEAEEDARGVLRTALTADLVTTPTPVLAEKYRSAGIRHVAVLENYLPTQWARRRRTPHQGLVVGWTAGRTHAADDARLGISQALARVLERHPEARVISIGHRLQLPPDRYEHIEQLPFPELIDHLARFDIGIAPLADMEFNRARSNVKLKEYAILGIPWLASPVGPYAQMGEAEGGRLVSDEGWEEALSRLIEVREERLLLGQSAAAWGKRQTSDHGARQWEAAFLGAVARTRAEGRA